MAHNPVCNLRIGSGVAPLRALLRGGVNVALGSDGISSNDSCRLFDVPKPLIMAVAIAAYLFPGQFPHGL